MVMVRSYEVDAILRKLGGPYDDGEEIVGKLYGRDITRKETREHPEILCNPAFLVKRRIQDGDWKCEHCGYLRPKTEYKCDNCGGPRGE